MRNLTDRRAVLAFLSGRWDFVALHRFETLDETAGAELLRWLDQSGLALYFAQVLTDSRMLDILSLQLRSELERRLAANRERTEDMLREFSRVNVALQDAGVEYAILKGFALTPEFCSEPHLRHQTDIDVLISANSASITRSSIVAIGYTEEGEEPSGEIRFGIQSGRAASANDFLYESQRHRQVEIHRSFYESVNGVSLRPDENWISHVEWKKLESVRFPVLDQPYRILGQLLHAFRHILHGWLRLGWLLEIDQVLKKCRQDTALWARVEGLMLGDLRVREACGVVLAMTHTAFGTDLPEFIEKRWVAPLRNSLVLWVNNFGLEWMLSDFPGSRSSLLLHREFADSTAAWQKFRLSRSKNRLRAVSVNKLTNPSFLVQRFRDQMEYFWQYLHWNIQLSKQSIGREDAVPHNSR
jgi:hypothetical protein